MYKVCGYRNVPEAFARFHVQLSDTWIDSVLRQATWWRQARAMHAVSAFPEENAKRRQWRKRLAIFS